MNNYCNSKWLISNNNEKKFYKPDSYDNISCNKSSNSKPGEEFENGVMIMKRELSIVDEINQNH